MRSPWVFSSESFCRSVANTDRSREHFDHERRRFVFGNPAQICPGKSLLKLGGVTALNVQSRFKTLIFTPGHQRASPRDCTSEAAS